MKLNYPVWVWLNFRDNVEGSAKTIIPLPSKFADDVKLRSCRARLPLQGVLTGWKNGNPKKSPTYATQSREGKWWGSHSCLQLPTEQVQTQPCQIPLKGAWKCMKGYSHKLQQGKLWPNIKKKPPQLSNKSDYTMRKKNSEAPNPHPSLEKVRVWPHLALSHLTQSEFWEGTAIITALLVRLFVGTTTRSRQRRRRMRLKPWHMSWAYQGKVNITVMKAMLLWNLQLCSSGVCQHHEFVDVDFSPGQSAFIGTPVLITFITSP